MYWLWDLKILSMYGFCYRGVVKIFLLNPLTEMSCYRNQATMKVVIDKPHNALLTLSCFGFPHSNRKLSALGVHPPSGYPSHPIMIHYYLGEASISAPPSWQSSQQNLPHHSSLPEHCGGWGERNASACHVWAPWAGNWLQAAARCGAPCSVRASR